MYFWNYRLSKAWLDHSLKSVVSEHPSTVNTLNGPKHLQNVYESTFVISFHHSVGKWFTKYLSYRNLGSHGCLLTLWVLITSMPFRIVRICGSLFKCNYPKNKKFSLYFLFHWSNLDQILNIFLKKKFVIADIFPKLQIVKHLLWQLSKKCRFRKSTDSQHVKGSQTLVKYAWAHFYHIFPSLWGQMIWKISPLLKF